MRLRRETNRLAASWPAVQRGVHVRVKEASKVDLADPKVRAVLFRSRAG